MKVITVMIRNPKDGLLRKVLGIFRKKTTNQRTVFDFRTLIYGEHDLNLANPTLGFMVCSKKPRAGDFIITKYHRDKADSRLFVLRIVKVHDDYIYASKFSIQWKFIFIISMEKNEQLPTSVEIEQAIDLYKGCYGRV